MENTEGKHEVELRPKRINDEMMIWRKQRR